MIGLLGSMLGSRGGRMVGQLIGGRTGGMIGGFAGAFLGGSQVRKLGGLFRGGDDARADAIEPMDDHQAEILIKAMTNAAKADGHVDDAEAEAIVSELGDLPADEQAFLRRELGSPFIPAHAVAALVPTDLAVEAYAVSLIAINVDTVEEADYLRQLASALGLSNSQRNDIHDDLGADLL